MHPDQTKTVKGQNSKILVTVGTIKRPLPCPVQRIKKKTEDFSRHKKEKQSKKRRKKIRTKTERKREEN